ncbi:MAG: nitroreductase family protein [Candidatus Bipolaricaulota bacterium]
MEVEKAILARRSVRSYRNKDVSRDLIEDIMDSVRMAPSASNRQDWRFVVVDQKSLKDKLFQLAGRQQFVQEAPVVIAGVSTDPGDLMTCGISAGIVDVSIALDHLTLRAAEEGLGTCWIGAFEQAATKELLEIPGDCEIVSLMTLGYPEKELGEISKQRHGLEEIVSYNSFSN